MYAAKVTSKGLNRAGKHEDGRRSVYWWWKFFIVSKYAGHWNLMRAEALQVAWGTPQTFLSKSKAEQNGDEFSDTEGLGDFGFSVSRRRDSYLIFRNVEVREPWKNICNVFFCRNKLDHEISALHRLCDLGTFLRVSCRPAWFSSFVQIVSML